MARSTNPKKLALWQGRFQRFEESALPVVRFCASEGVSESSFYYWLKKLRPPGHLPPRRASSLGATGHDVFKPVTVVPATCGVVVWLPGGARIEVDASQLDAIQTVVAATVQRDYSRANGQGASSDGHVNGKRNGTVPC